MKQELISLLHRIYKAGEAGTILDLDKEVEDFLAPVRETLQKELAHEFDSWANWGSSMGWPTEDHLQYSAKEFLDKRGF